MVLRLGYGENHRFLFFFGKTFFYLKKTEVAPDVLIVTLDRFLIYFRVFLFFVGGRGAHSDSLVLEVGLWGDGGMTLASLWDHFGIT